MGRTYGSVEELVEAMNQREAGAPNCPQPYPPDRFVVLEPGESVVLIGGWKITNQSETWAVFLGPLPVRDIPKPPR